MSSPTQTFYDHFFASLSLLTQHTTYNYAALAIKTTIFPQVVMVLLLAADS